MANEVIFSAYHTPSLIPGDYVIQVGQEIHTLPERVPTTSNHYIPATTYPSQRTFRVAGDRFRLKGDEVVGCFPPDGSLGDHSNVLPHVVLERSTLPWEHRPDPNNTTPTPWLALLVFDEAEAPPPQAIPLSQLGAGGVDFPSVTLNQHEQPADSVQVIDVPRALLESLLPTWAELPYLAHVRQNPGEEGEVAVLLAKRLPQAGGTTVVHLVSLEGRYNAQGFVFSGAPLVRLVSLYTWRFSCVDANHTFSHMVKGLLEHHQAFRLPDSPSADANLYLREGFIPVQHELRQGGGTLSWYRGPLSAGELPDEMSPPVHTSDALLRYHADVGMWDVSYATAWQLGRLLALQNSAFATNLYQWKRNRDQAYKRQQTEKPNQPLQAMPLDTAIPDSVSAWFEALTRFEGVPLKYLIPVEDLLPVESIRFFQLDVNWINALLDGAYSIGRVTRADFDRDCAHPIRATYGERSGVLIRSDLVTGYPDLLIDATDAAGNPLAKLPPIRLAESILLCLFEGQVGQVIIHQKPEALHFGLELNPDNPLAFHKSPRMAATATPYAGTLEANRNVPIIALADNLFALASLPQGSRHAGSFALSMLEVAEKVTFKRSV